MVYGEPALVTSIDSRTVVEIERNSEKKVLINSKGVGRLKGDIKKDNGIWSIENKKGDIAELKFVSKAIEKTLNHLRKAGGLEIRIESNLPLGSGLGSSSAVTTAVIGATSSLLGERMDKENISQLAYNTEVEIQGAASRAGVTVATHGGFLKIEGEEMVELNNLLKPKLLIGYTGTHANTAELVESVRKLKESKPKLIEPIIETIGRTTEIGIEALNEKDLEKVGALMNVNQNLLEGLNVSSPKLRKLIKAAKEAGSIGAKLTGSGGGGCMIALTEDNMKEIERSIKEKNGDPIRAKVGVEGLKY